MLIRARLQPRSVSGSLFDPDLANSEASNFQGPTWNINQDEQARLFEAFFQVASGNNLMQGLFTWGFDYTAQIDNGPSIAGKSAERVIREHYAP